MSLSVFFMFGNLMSLLLLSANYHCGGRAAIWTPFLNYLHLTASLAPSAVRTSDIRLSQLSIGKLRGC